MSEILAIVVKCDGCEKVVIAQNAEFEAEVEGLCNACSGGDSYTCFCNGGVASKALCFSCPECKKYSSITVY